MSLVGSTPAASACSACERPLPSAQTAALFDMFWALNGATLIPRRAKIRHKAATIMLFPAEDDVPCTISTRPAISPPPRVRPKHRADCDGPPASAIAPTGPPA